MKQSNDPFEVATEEQDESPPDSPVGHEETGTQTPVAQPIVSSRGGEVNKSSRNLNSRKAIVASASTSAAAKNVKNKEDDDEEEEENMDVELGKFPSSSDPSKMATMQ